jgi:hypothetical protein
MSRNSFLERLRLHVLRTRAAVSIHSTAAAGLVDPVRFDSLCSVLRSRLAQTGDDFLPAGEQINGNELDARVLVLEYRRAPGDGDDLCPFGRAGL